ncbi:DHH family phosphoesterase [Haloparvum sedimenti]|uniref:DHH family phosphoesterase n=1 Tax=Haloparvum sedimenti TaxID=1678448 RepID=UPI00071E7D06|nr:OB-fold nucleic acid binding domain-containing protein [Haloparvum sedimenti]
MGSCIICGASVDGRICDSHQEDVGFEFRGDSPHQLVSGRYYRGTVDGYADFGVFVDLAPGVTGLLHRSELDRRLDSLDWEPGDTVYVQVKNVRDNGNVDLAWSIRQSERDFRGNLVQEDGTEFVPGEDAGEEGEPETEESESEPDAEASAEEESPEPADESEAESEADSGFEAADVVEAEEADPAEAEQTEAEPAEEQSEPAADEAESGESADEEPTEAEADEEPAETDAALEHVLVESLGDRVGDEVRIEGEVVSVRQTGGPTVFEVRDRTGVVDCAAFVEPGVRAYPGVELGDVVRLDGEVELRHDEIQVETEALAVLEGDEAAAVQQRLADALTDRARPDAVDPLGDDETVAALSEGLLDAAEAIRRAVLESRPVVVRHPATADGYVAGAAIERATLPLVREEHAKRDAVYHYFTRRPLEGAVYDMDAATNDATRMLQDRDRHDEKLPLFLLVGTGSTVESEDGLGLLDVYDADAVVVDAAVADPETRETVDTLVSPELADVDGSLSTGALVASLAAAVNDDVREDLTHLPAVSYWEETPDAYVEAAAEAGYDAERVAELREAIALEAYYQSYQDKRELVTDLLFEDGGDLAAHVSEQFREKLETEVQTAEANLETEHVDNVTFDVLDTEAYTHKYDFPPTPLLLDELHRRNREGDFATVGIGMDELYVRTTADVSVREVAAEAAETAPEADISVAGVREGKIEFLSGAREAVENAVVAAVADQF